MTIPHLHLFHPPATRNPQIIEWLAEVQSLLHGDPSWDSCQFHRLQYNEDGSFYAPTVADNVLRNEGPVIAIAKVQASALERFRRLVERMVSVYATEPKCAEDIWQACEVAKQAFNDGEPRISLRELLAYLIIRKLANQDKWGGTAKNKSFLWVEDLPRGGFPKEYSDKREIMDVVDVLVNAGVLERKLSESKCKVALGNKALVQPIIDKKSFEGLRTVQKYFNRGNRFVPARLINYNSE